VWKAIYPIYSQQIRVLTLTKKPALLLPHFDHPSDRKDETVLAAIKHTLLADYHRQGWLHGDVAWRNVGIRREGKGVKAVLFDMDEVREINGQDETWVEDATAKLKKRA
jgi:hypothetical protein